MSDSLFIIRSATSADTSAIFSLIKELALYEKAPHEVINTPEKLLNDGFGSTSPLFTAEVAEWKDGSIIGFSLCYIRYSTWKGPVLYLEDLYVQEQYRRYGIGKALFENCIEMAKREGYKRLAWQVLDWNQPAIDFYKKWNASLDPEWINGSIDI
ncbi:MAG: GNAT family N-acetyltransferase [Bacteroidetes bacterium]|jgi:GNAT superfamily N-acetyltransferase|nr:GNAT family N-acetyltransferase [Bacteroidota bacterium]